MNDRFHFALKGVLRETASKEFKFVQTPRFRRDAESPNYILKAGKVIYTFFRQCLPLKNENRRV